MRTEARKVAPLAFSLGWEHGCGVWEGKVEEGLNYSKPPEGLGQQLPPSGRKGSGLGQMKGVDGGSPLKIVIRSKLPSNRRAEEITLWMSQ